MTRRYEVWQDAASQWRWRFQAGNNRTISSGESYYNRADCEYAVALMRASADAPLFIQPQAHQSFLAQAAANALTAPNLSKLNAFRGQSALAQALRDLPQKG